ncbi:MAG: dTMP kinase, partial [Chloroflexi bacterium]|nr:dTMP kinase [Chloroflexota bacterium]
MAPPTGAAGRFVTIEGGEGTGKTTLLAALAERSRSGGLDVVTCREPGGTALGERLRTALLGADGAAPDPRAELLVFAAARAQLVAEVIRPALERGALVLCDRYADSTTAYQHHGRGLPRETVVAVNAAATGGLTPDLTLLLDLPATEGLRRAGRAGDYMER